MTPRELVSHEERPVSSENLLGRHGTFHMEGQEGGLCVSPERVLLAV